MRFGQFADEIAALKAGTGKPIVATGGIILTNALVAAEPVDEYRLSIYPVALGRGRRRFPEGSAPPALRFMESRSFPSGVVALRYRAEGADRTA